MPRNTKREKNWSDDALAAYIAERNQAALERIFGERKQDVKVENCKSGFNPQRWWR